ncbi:MAG: NosD domain-containing protein, partial [Planctomycetota bacterium]
HPWRLKTSTPCRNPSCYVDDDDGKVTGLPNISPCTELDAVSNVPNPTDRINNVEVVLVPYVETDQVGTWTARVTATSMPSASGYDSTFSLILPFDHDVDCGDVLTTDTTLLTDLECSGGTAITMGADNITLDCDGHTIKGDGSRMGVDLGGTSGVTVQSCTIEDFTYGIDAGNADSCTLAVNELSGSFTNIYMKEASSCWITGNAIGAASYHGINLSGTGNLIDFNEMEENETAIRILSDSSTSSNALNLNVIGHGGTGAIIQGESTSLSANSICYPDETGLLLKNTAAETLATGNILCHAGNFDIELSDFVRDPNDIRDPGSDSNVCSSYNTNPFGAFWADASVAAGCTIGCSNLTCEPVTVPPELDDEWDGLDTTADVEVTIERVLTGDVTLGNGFQSFGSAASVTPTPSGKSFLLRRIWDDNDLGAHRRTGMRLHRRDLNGNVWEPAPRSGPASVRNALTAVVDQPGVYMAFGRTCDVEIPPASSTLATTTAQDIQPGDTVCLEPGGTYDSAAMELDMDGVTLDCRGASLTGVGTCLNVHDALDVEVIGCRFDGCAVGVRAERAPGIRLRLNEARGGGEGFQVTASPGAMMEGNTACGQSGNAFTVDSRPEIGFNACDQGCDIGCFE